MYGQLDSPIPGLTVTHDGDRCCGMRGHLLGMLGADPLIVDTTSTDPGGLVDPNFPVATPEITPPDFTLPLPNVISPSLESMYPPTVGTEFVGNGDGTYTNIQTGQTVPFTIAQQITAATSGSATQNLQTASTGGNITITDPNSGATSTIPVNNLTAAAQALQSAGQLVNAAGKLTSQGQALLNSGSLYNPAAVSGAGANISAAMSSLTSWFTGSTIFPGFPNYGVVGVGLLVATVGLSLLQSKPKRRRR
jgi:adhesin HecA-like repeat protein